MQKYELKVRNSLKVTFGLMFVVMLVKCQLNGFEFINTTLVMAVCPVMQTCSTTMY